MSSPPVHLSGGRFRDWTSLPPELLHHISSEYLRHLPDFIRFRSVCPIWRSSTTAAPAHLPWFLIDPRPLLESKTDESPATSYLRFYSLFTKKTHKVPIFIAKGMYLHGPGNQYIITYTDDNNHFLNPLTGDEICLPLLLSEFGDIDIGPIPFYNREFVGCYMEFELMGMLVFRRVTESDWKTFQFPLTGEGHTLYKGKYYIYVEESQGLMVVDMDTGSIESILVLPHESSEEDEEDETHAFFNYLIESSRELLRVCRRCDDRFDVYSVDLDCKNPRWVKKSSIGDMMLFLDVFDGFSFRARDFPGFRGNCIYFMYHLDGTYDRYTLRKYYLENGRIEGLTGPLTGNGTWFVPSL